MNIPKRLYLSPILTLLFLLSYGAFAAIPAHAQSITPDKLHGHIFVDWSKHAHIEQLDGVVTCPSVSEPNAACTTGPTTVDFDVNIVNYTPNGWFDISASSLRDQCTVLAFSPVGEFFGDTNENDGDLGDIHLNPHGNLHIHGHAEDCVDGKYTIDVASDVFDGRHLSVSFTIEG